jgi:hypothetical protein
MIFQVGQIVRCINAAPMAGVGNTLLTLNQLYVVREAHPNSIRVEGIPDLRFFAHRFVLATPNDVPMPEPTPKQEAKPTIELNARAKQAAPKPKPPQQQVNEPKPPFSSLPIYRIIRRKITDVNDRNRALAGLKREYTKANIVASINSWKKSRTVSNRLMWASSPEGGQFWASINKRIQA